MHSTTIRQVLLVILTGVADISNGGGAQGQTPTSGPLTFTAVSAGLLYTCGLTAGGAAYCWGSKGHLGDGTTLQIDDPRSVFLPHPQPVPVLVVGALSFAVVRAGNSHTCGITTAGAAYCWGSNGSGELGDGSPHDFDSWAHGPVPVAGGLSFSAVSPGRDHTCGITTAGAAYCWGRNTFGILADGGDGSGPYRTSPAAVVGKMTFATARTGDFHTCGLTAEGAAYCWGLNDAGQLGDGTALALHQGRSSPVPVTGGMSFTTVSAGSRYTCAVTADGGAYCWGDNRAGQLGDGTTTSRSSPTLVAGSLSFAAVSTGGGHTCALTPTGAAYCWGDNRAGQLGDGTKTDQSSPVPVAGGLSFASVSTGFNHTCGVTTAGAAYCWGANDHGQLGDGTTKKRSRPVRVVQ